MQFSSCWFTKDTNRKIVKLFLKKMSFDRKFFVHIYKLYGEKSLLDITKFNIYKFNVSHNVFVKNYYKAAEKLQAFALLLAKVN